MIVKGLEEWARQQLDFLREKLPAKTDANDEKSEVGALLTLRACAHLVVGARIFLTFSAGTCTEFNNIHACCYAFSL